MVFGDTTPLAAISQDGRSKSFWARYLIRVPVEWIPVKFCKMVIWVFLMIWLAIGKNSLKTRWLTGNILQGWIRDLKKEGAQDFFGPFQGLFKEFDTERGGCAPPSGFAPVLNKMATQKACVWVILCIVAWVAFKFDEVIPCIILMIWLIFGKNPLKSRWPKRDILKKIATWTACGR